MNIKTGTPCYVLNSTVSSDKYPAVLIALSDLEQYISEKGISRLDICNYAQEILEGKLLPGIVNYYLVDILPAKRGKFSSKICYLEEEDIQFISQINCPICSEKFIIEDDYICESCRKIR
jgi:5'(3')-deoxyribonucleotidase